jgi:hypothetical protein
LLVTKQEVDINCMVVVEVVVVMVAGGYQWLIVYEG